MTDNERRARAKALFQRNRSGELYREAAAQGVTLSAFLEQEDPSTEDDQLDAFGRMLREAGIRTYSDPAAGIWADSMAVFDKPENRHLLPEWAMRRWREAMYGRPANPRARIASHTIGTGPNARQVYTSADEAIGSFFRPYQDVFTTRDPRVPGASLPLTRLTALDTGISGDSYRASYMKNPAAADLTMVRVAELGEIPLAVITTGKQEITIGKYGRGFEMSYEAMRRAPIDKAAFWIQRQAIQTEVDKVGQAIETLINGDGNGNAATSVNLTTLDSAAVAGTLTFKAWLAAKELAGDAYSFDLAITTTAVKPQLFLLNTGNAFIPAQTLQAVGGVREANGRLNDTVDVATNSYVPASKIMLVDTSAALEHVVENGSRIQETDRFVTRQSEVLVLSEVEGFAVLDQAATKIVNLAA